MVHTLWSLKSVVHQNLEVREGQVPVSHNCVHSLDHTHGLAAEANLPWHPSCHLPLGPCIDSQALVAVCRTPHAAGTACHSLPQGADPDQYADPFPGTVQLPCDKSKRMTHVVNDVVGYVLASRCLQRKLGHKLCFSKQHGQLTSLVALEACLSGQMGHAFRLHPTAQSPVTGHPLFEYLNLGSTVGKVLLFASTCPDATYCCCCFVWCC